MIGHPEHLKLSEHTSVEVAILDGDETDSADIIVAGRTGGPNRDGDFPVLAFGILQPKIYAVCSIRKFNGEEAKPLHNESQYRALAKRLTVAEKKELGKWAQPHYSPADEEVKNEPSGFDE